MAVADFAPLTAGDADALRRQVGPLLVGVAEVQVTQRVAASRYAQAPAAIVGSSPEIQPIRSWEMAVGRFYTAEDMRRPAADLTGHGTILLVEDEETLRVLNARGLTSRVTAMMGGIEPPFRPPIVPAPEVPSEAARQPARLPIVDPAGSPDLTEAHPLD